MRVYYDRDADINLIQGKKVCVVGYGSQGHAHALNLRDSGVKNVAVALRKGSATVKKAEAAGLKVMTPAEAAKWADVLMMLTPDELQADIYRDDLRDNMKKGAALMFAHGLNVHFALIEPRPDLDVILENHPSHLGHLDPPLSVPNESKPVGTDHRPGVDHHPIADDHVLEKHDVGVDLAIRPDLATLSDVGVGMDPALRPDPGSRSDVRHRADRRRGIDLCARINRGLRARSLAQSQRPPK